MKSKSILAAGALAFAMVFSLNVMAASDTVTDGTAVAAPQPEAKQKMRPHSHMEEKMGVMAKAEPEMHVKPALTKPNPAKDQGKHFHPRDGK